MGRYPKVDLDALARADGVRLREALEALLAFYAEVDALNELNTRDLNLPCYRGCDACCHESVFLTPLEFFCVWERVQDTFEDEERFEVVEKGLKLYDKNRDLIEAFERPPPPGEKDHFSIARNLRFRCPLLGEHGECRVYPVREMYARLFGCSFNDEGGVYGCNLVGERLAGKEVTLLKARAVARRLDELPLTGKRQVYPYYIHMLYAAK